MAGDQLLPHRQLRRFEPADGDPGTGQRDTSIAYEYDMQGALSRLAHDLAGGASDVAYTYARNQAQEIVSQNRSNNAYAWRPGFDRKRGYTVNGLNQYGQYDPNQFTYHGAGNLSGDDNGNWATTPTTG